MVVLIVEEKKIFVERQNRKNSHKPKHAVINSKHDFDVRVKVYTYTSLAKPMKMFGFFGTATNRIAENCEKKK